MHLVLQQLQRVLACFNVRETESLCDTVMPAASAQAQLRLPPTKSVRPPVISSAKSDQSSPAGVSATEAEQQLLWN